MAVTTAAATTMANKAETARPRRNTAARTSIRRNMDVRGARARPPILCVGADGRAFDISSLMRNLFGGAVFSLDAARRTRGDEVLALVLIYRFKIEHHGCRFIETLVGDASAKVVSLSRFGIEAGECCFAREPLEF